MTRVTGITVVWNDPRVRFAAGSTLSQEGDVEVEAVVVDGASGAETQEALTELRERGAVVVSEPDDGIYDAMNKGIELATGDVIGILGADDRYKGTDVFATVAAAMDATGAGACYADLEYVDGAGRVRRRWQSGPPSRWKWYAGWMPPHPTFFVRRELLLRYGGFDTSYRIAADYDLMRRLLFTHRVPVTYIPSVHVSMGMWGTSNAGIRQVLQANLEVSRSWRRGGALVAGAVVPVLKVARKPFQFLGAGPG